MPHIILEGYHCNRCGHDWASRNGTGYRDKKDPTYCQKCRSPYWNKPRILGAYEQRQNVEVRQPHIHVEGYLCERCGYRWCGRDGSGRWADEDPKTCPKCRSELWNLPRRIKVSDDRRTPPWNAPKPTPTKVA